MGTSFVGRRRVAIFASVALLAALLTVDAASCSVALAQEEVRPSEAQALFMAGRVAFEEGRFDAAIGHFEASYQLSQRPQLLYNIAQCHDRLRHDRDAIAAFERYLSADPNADNRVAVEARLRALRESVAQADAQNAATKRASSEDQAEAANGKVTSLPATGESAASARFPLGPVVVMGSALLLGASGGVLMFLGSKGGNEVENATQGASYRDLRDDLDKAQRQWTTGQVLLGVGALAGGVGLAWLVMERRQAHSSLRISILPNTLRLSGSF